LEQAHIDPRTVRTRKLLTDSFMQLVEKKDFNNVSIKDITDAATVNRATFYAHFKDKYDLLDAVVTENILESLMAHLSCQDELSEETMKKIFYAMTGLHEDLNTRWKKSYEAFSITIEKKMKAELEKLFYALFLKKKPNLNDKALHVGSVMLSWAIYGAAVDWQKNRSLSAKDYFEQALPFISKGIMLF
jgi:AcrR family transcriptional regulator